MSNRSRYLIFVPLALILSSCSTVIEGLNAYNEPPSMEMALERVNTGARALELGDLMLHGIPISAASEWPRQVASQVPSREFGKLMGSVMLEGIYAYGSGFNPSPIKIRVLYQQGLLFEEFPNMYYERKYLETDPNPESVKAYGKAVLGDKYNEAFYRSFHYFLKYSPAFRPKKELFLGTFNGRAPEVYANVREAVLSLADNREALGEILRELDNILDEKKLQIRNIDEATNDIRELKNKEKKASRDEKSAISGEIDKKKDEIKIHSVDLAEINKRYKEQLGIWVTELAKIRKQVTALDEEQIALAKNIQHVVEAIKEINIEATTLVAVAIIKIPTSILNMPNELNQLVRSPFADIRVQRIVSNSVTLFDNAMIIRTELGVLTSEADSLDDLFEMRIKTEIGKKG